MSDRIITRRNVWKPLAMILVGVALLSATLAPMPAQADVPPIMTTFEVEDFTGELGEIVAVDVMVYDAEGLYGWQIDLWYDIAVLAYVSHTFSNYLEDAQPDGAAQVFSHEGTMGNIMASEVTLYAYPGVTNSSALMITIEFEILEVIGTTLDIDTLWTYWLEDATTVWGDAEGEMIKENGTFIAPWPEDFNKDGIIDIFDIAQVAVFYGEPLTLTRNPSSWTSPDPWNTPEYAQTSDDTYAWTASDGAYEIYSGYGYNTASWKAVTQVRVGIEAWQEASGEWVKIRVSGDGGTTWGAIHDVTPLPTADPDTVTWVDVTADLSWTPSNLSDANFQVWMEYDKAGSAGDVYVDWIPVQVSFRPYADLNNDDSVDIFDLTQVAALYGERYL